MNVYVHTYSILSVPFYDARQQQYTKILCINAVPVAGALATRVKTVRPPRLSGLSSASGPCNSSNNKCIHALTRAHGISGSGGGCGSGSGCGSDYMTPDELPELFAFLASNGYTVDLGLTKLAAKHQSGGGGGGSGGGGACSNTNSNSLVCLVSYAGSCGVSP